MAHIFFRAVKFLLKVIQVIIEAAILFEFLFPCIFRVSKLFGQLVQRFLSLERFSDEPCCKSLIGTFRWECNYCRLELILQPFSAAQDIGDFGIQLAFPQLRV